MTNRAITVEEQRIKAVYERRCSEHLYSLFEPAQLFALHQLENSVLGFLRAHDFLSLKDKRILDVGCGDGYWLREFIEWGASPENITGVDLLFDRVATARRLCAQGMSIHCGNAASLSFPNESFDVVMQCTMFTSVLDSQMRRLIAGEMSRVVKAEGFIIWYDYYVNNPRNPDVRGIRKREIAQLFPDCQIEIQKVTLAPPLARLVAPYSWLACYALERMKLFNTHYLAVIRKT